MELAATAANMGLGRAFCPHGRRFRVYKPMTEARTPESRPATPEPRDDQLMQQIAEARDKKAFVVLFDRLAPRVKGYLLKLRCSEMQAEEIVQEVMLTVWQKAATFDRSKAQVTTWTFTVARNRFIDRMRRVRDGLLDPEDPSLAPSAPVAADEMVELQQRKLRVREAIDRLPKDQQSVIRMSFIEGRSHQEIADACELPLGTVKSRMRLAFAKLRDGLQELQ